MKILPITLTLLALVLACDRSAKKDAHAGHDHANAKTSGHDHGNAKDEDHEGHEHGKEIVLKLADVRGVRMIQVPEPRLAGSWFPAEAAGDETAQGVLASPVKGIISAIPGAPGRPVGHGAPLMVIQSPELARLKADWLNAKARLARAESELAREQQLFDAKAGSRRELEAAKADASTARADEEATRLVLQAMGLQPEQAGPTFTLKAPRAGVVSAWKVQAGQGVEPGQELGAFQAALAALAQVEIPLPAPEGWKPGAVADVRAGDGRRWKGRLESAPLALTQDTRRMSYRLRLTGAPLPMAGTPLEVEVPLARAITLPQGALQQLDGAWGVFVKEGDVAAFRPVKRGADLGTDVLVLGGVKPGETVVAEGAYLLKAFHRKNTGAEEAGHVH